MSHRWPFGGYAPQYLISFYKRLPGVFFTLEHLARTLDVTKPRILEVAQQLEFKYNPDHPEFTSEQAIAMIRKLHNLEED